jgi:hypothetical protein
MLFTEEIITQLSIYRIATTLKSPFFSPYLTTNQSTRKRKEKWYLIFQANAPSAMGFNVELNKMHFIDIA